MPGTLDGIVILDLSTGPAAALSTMMLSDQGARVIRVTGPDEPLFRDGGFTGTLVSEWEGHAYLGDDGFDQVEKHQAMCRRIFAGH